MDKLNLSEYTETALTLSTSHVTEDTANWLDSIVKGGVKSSIVVYDKNKYGWFIATSGEHGEDVPADLAFLIGLAMGSGHDWLQLDSDAAIVEGINSYDW